MEPRPARKAAGTHRSSQAWRPKRVTLYNWATEPTALHPGALAHPSPRAALVLGGGDGGAANISTDTLAERLAARRIDSLKHYEPAMHAGLFSASRSVRDKLSQVLKPTR